MVKIKVMFPVQEFLSCIGDILVRTLSQTTIVRSTITDNRVVIGLTVCCRMVQVYFSCQRETVWQSNLSIEQTIQYVSAYSIHIHRHLVRKVTIFKILRCGIILLVAICIQSVCTISVMQINRINRSHVTSYIEWISIESFFSIFIKASYRRSTREVQT